VYVSHYELAEFGLVALRDTVPYRRRGRVAGGPDVEMIDGPRLEAYRFQLTIGHSTATPLRPSAND
jgi:hypothetical protein